MRKIALLIWVCLLCACSVEAPYSTSSDTKIQIDVRQVSAGYAQAEFTPDRDAYYLVAIDEVVEGVDPHKIERTFMQLALDSAYMVYVNWRYAKMMSGTPVHQIAPFQSHSLQYGHTDHFVYFLKPNTDYWVYAFAVDPEANRPVSHLSLQTIHTLPKSQTVCHFRYRVKGLWDYVYPYDKTNTTILSDFPYVGATMDSVTLRRRCEESQLYFPALFFADSLQRVMDQHLYDYRILHGIYAHYNDGVGDGTSVTEFEEGKTYYTAFAGVDGALVPGMDQNAVYRFTWHEDLDTVFPFSAALGWHEW